MESEKIKAFLDFVNESQSCYNLSLESMKNEEKRLQDFLHAIEFETNVKERSKICTKLHLSRKARRGYKDQVEIYEPIVRFFQDSQNKRTLDKLKQLLGEIRRVEKYHRDRTYIPRVKEN
ncbi:MAG: hypothetical protein HFI92_06480 [Lachnospiraceae bacterium]|nr:hypothetical protein [Lachnospiraceae bacterium]